MKLHQFKECVSEYVNREQRIEFGSEDDGDTSDIEDEQEPVQVTPREALAMIDCLMHTNCISDEYQIRFGVKENLEKVVINSQKQKDIRKYFLSIIIS